MQDNWLAKVFEDEAELVRWFQGWHCRSHGMQWEESTLKGFQIAKAIGDYEADANYEDISFGESFDFGDYFGSNRWNPPLLALLDELKESGTVQVDIYFNYTTADRPDLN